LTEGFEKLLISLKSKIDPLPSKSRSNRSGRQSSNPRKQQTQRSEIIAYLLDALNELGGSARCNDVLDLMEKKFQEKFLPGDFEVDKAHGTKWRHNTHWARLILANEGVFEKESPRGYWQIRKKEK
jgi:hypothetical protein